MIFINCYVHVTQFSNLVSLLMGDDMTNLSHLPILCITLDKFKIALQQSDFHNCFKWYTLSSFTLASMLLFMVDVFLLKFSYLNLPVMIAVTCVCSYEFDPSRY